MLLFGFILLSYIICRAILPLRLHWGWKAGLVLAAALAAFKFHILHWFGGEMFFAPELPVPVLLGAAWYYAVFFLFSFCWRGRISAGELCWPGCSAGAGSGRNGSGLSGTGSIWHCWRGP